MNNETANSRRSLTKYVPNSGDIVMALLFGGIGAFGIVSGAILYAGNSLSPIFLVIGGIILVITSALPVSGLLWTDGYNNLYLFPSRLKYNFMKK